MTDEKELLTCDQAVALLPDGETIHTFMQAGPVLLGADWSRVEILELLSATDCIEVPGPEAQSMGHGLVAWRDAGPVFIETRREPR